MLIKGNMTSKFQSRWSQKKLALQDLRFASVDRIFYVSAEANKLPFVFIVLFPSSASENSLDYTICKIKRNR